MIGTIVFTVAILAMPYDGEPVEWYYFYESLNFICTMVFTGEMVAKIWPLTWRDYWADNFEDSFKWNRFDAFVVFVSWVE